MASLLALGGSFIALLIGALGFQHWRNTRQEKKLSLARAFAEIQRVEAEAEAELTQEVQRTRNQLAKEVRARRASAAAKISDSPDPLADVLNRLGKLRKSEK